MGSYFAKLRSESLGDRQIKDMTPGLVKRLGRGVVSFHQAMTLEAFTLLRDHLDPLDAFSMVRSVVVNRPVGPGRSDREPYLGAILGHGPGRSRMFLRLYGTESEESGPFDFSLSYGWQMDQKGDNFPHCKFEVAGNSPGVADLGYRRDLFRRIIGLIGLADSISIAWDGGNLRASAANGWQAVPIKAHLDGANPIGISVRGFSTVEAAVDAGERIIGQVLRRVDDCEFSAYAEGDDYETRLRPLSAIAGGWQLRVGGALSEAAGAVLAGTPTSRPPARVPAFVWEEKEGSEWHSPWTVYSGELVAIDSGCCLELATNRGGMDRLLDYAGEIKGLAFTPLK
ncbi:hypothetical protein [Singulisphaera sp. PoT]|uniref:hypothetical protein n=1 Tax=Singulisphaera sp. PoT TaxID=3411797 RepID=UPI003BF4A169